MTVGGRHVWRWLLFAASGAVVLGISSCSTVGYYVDTAVGHLRVLEAARPVDDWLADPKTPDDLRRRLEAVKEMRAFAVTALDLPDNASYRSYADLHRPFVVWNVFAAPALSLDLHEWCFPVAGCVKYRGYFNKADAESYAASLKAQGLDVQVAGIPAYSTLGFTPDPVLSTFIYFPKGEVARLIFHELGHQKVYLPGDSTFNESYATTVEEEGVKRWLVAQHDPQESRDYAIFTARRKRFLDLLMQSRSALEKLYASGLSDDEKLAQKAAIFAALKASYARAKADPADPLYAYPGYDQYFAQPLNNANLAAIAAYTQLGPAFVKLLQDDDGQLPRFYADVRALTKMGKAERQRRLDDLMREAGQEPVKD